MKRNVIILLICAVFSFHSFSQNPIPNADFENWTDDNHPQSWYGLTVDLFVYQIYTLSKTTDAHTGNFAALIETKDASLMALPGIASLSDMAIDLMGGGLTFTSAGAPLVNVRPTKILGNFKYLGVNGDTGMIAAVFTKWNPTTNQRDTIGMTGSIVNAVVSSYTPFQFNVTLTETPDSMNILLVSSGGFNPQIGSALFIDNLSMEYTSTDGIGTMQLLGTSVYPNPATDQVFFSLPGEGQSDVYVYDMTGKLVINEQMQNSSFFLNVQHLSNGIYNAVIQQNSNTYHYKIKILR